MKTKNLKIPVLFTTFLLLQACASTGRGPASIQTDAEGKEIAFDTTVYSEIISQDTGRKRAKYSMDFRFATDIDQEYLRKKARAAFQTAIAKTLSTDDPEKGVAARFKENMMGAVISEFVKTLYVFKIINGTIQVDLTFFPETDDPGTFNEELSSNQLVRWNDTGHTLENFEAFENPNDMESLNKFLKHPVMQDRLAQGRHAYLGGTITLWIKLVDMHFNPENPIPNPAKNAVKGTVRFRRIYATQGLDESRIACTNKVIEKLTFAKGKKDYSAHQNHQFLTVDHVKSFNLKHLVPKDDSVEFYYGHMLPNHKGRKGLVAAEGHKESPLKTGELQALVKEDSYTKFKHRIGTLSWSFEDNAFSQKNSVIKSQAFEDFPSEEPANPYWAQKEFLNECKNGLIDSLGIAGFLPKGAH